MKNEEINRYLSLFYPADLEIPKKEQTLPFIGVRCAIFGRARWRYGYVVLAAVPCMAIILPDHRLCRLAETHRCLDIGSQAKV
jgi:hypothetical protein